MEQKRGLAEREGREEESLSGVMEGDEEGGVDSSLAEDVSVAEVATVAEEAWLLLLLAAADSLIFLFLLTMFLHKL